MSNRLIKSIFNYIRDFKLSHCIDAFYDEGDGKINEYFSGDEKLKKELKELITIKKITASFAEENPPENINAMIMRRIRMEEPHLKMRFFLFRSGSFIFDRMKAARIFVVTAVIFLALLPVFFLKTGWERSFRNQYTLKQVKLSVLEDSYKRMKIENVTDKKNIYIHDMSRDTGKRRVKFSINYPMAKSVRLFGDFNNWSESGVEMKDENGNGLWSIELDLKKGIYRYIFLIDEKKWVVDEKADTFIADGFGGHNGVIFIM